MRNWRQLAGLFRLKRERVDPPPVDPFANLYAELSAVAAAALVPVWNEAVRAAVEAGIRATTETAKAAAAFLLAEENSAAVEESGELVDEAGMGLDPAPAASAEHSDRDVSPGPEQPAEAKRSALLASMRGQPEPVPQNDLYGILQRVGQG